MNFYISEKMKDKIIHPTDIIIDQPFTVHMLFNDKRQKLL